MFGSSLRFDDRIATVIALGEDGPGAVAAKWRQLVDLLAQSNETEPFAKAYAYLRDRRYEVPAEVRRETARSLGGHRLPPELIAFFGEDEASIAGHIFMAAPLPAGEWLRLLPRLTPTARALLRHRRDLDEEVDRALMSFGVSDFVLAGQVGAVVVEAATQPALVAAEPIVAPAAAPERQAGGETQIRDLVARIEAFRKQREEGPAPLASDRIEQFRWESGTDGAILWVGDAPRGPLIGQSIASIADAGQFGVDGQAAGAFEKKAPFRDARFRVPGAGGVSGDWRISGVPFFDMLTGAFRGYRGSARRPRIDEVAQPHGVDPIPAGLFGGSVSAEALRQLVHELRTPLNAIVGFAEMIDGEYMGPAEKAYRSRASEIMEQASRLLSAVDDLDTAARIETRRLSLEDSSTDAVGLLCRLHDAYERVAHQRSARLAIEIERHLPAAKVELGAAERMLARILAATVGLAQECETISATMTVRPHHGQRMLCLAIDRPRAIAGREDAALLDPGYSPDGDWPGAPALGLGFALRLVRNLAEAAGGALVIDSKQFSLFLPTIEEPELTSEQSR